MHKGLFLYLFYLYLCLFTSIKHQCNTWLIDYMSQERCQYNQFFFQKEIKVRNSFPAQFLPKIDASYSDKTKKCAVFQIITKRYSTPKINLFSHTFISSTVLKWYLFSNAFFYLQRIMYYFSRSVAYIFSNINITHHTFPNIVNNFIQ